MPISNLAAFISSVPAITSRRGIVAGLASGLFATGFISPGQGDAEARKKGRRKKHRKNRKDKSKPKIRVDATCAGSDSIGTGATDGDSRIARTFTAEGSGELVKATIPITKDLDSDGDLELRLSPIDDAGFPTDDVLAVSIVPDDEVPDDGADIDFPFANPFSVKAGVDYALVLTRPGGGGFAWFGFTGTGCEGLSFFSPAQTGPFEPRADDLNLVFTTFVRS